MFFVAEKRRDEARHKKVVQPPILFRLIKHRVLVTVATIHTQHYILSLFFFVLTEWCVGANDGEKYFKKLS